MKTKVILFTIAVLIGVSPLIVQAGPKQDLKAFQTYYKKLFPNVKYEDLINGIYALDDNLREQWEAIEEFPPYEIAIEEGETLWNTPFKNGKKYANCFRNGGIGVKSSYPYYDRRKDRVVTLAADINECRKKNGEKPLKYKKGKMASILSYLAFTTRGKKINTKIPNTPGALKKYEAGKSFYFSRRGQLSISCAHCHIDNAGNKIRGNLLGTTIGQVSHWPVYRSKWGAVGTLHRRFTGCNKQVRAKPFKAQSEEYRNLEYFLSSLSNGLIWNGPGSRF